MTRLGDATHIGAVRLQVGDRERSVEFYRDVLGFTVQESVGDTVKLGVPGSAHPLVELVARAGTAPVRPYSRLGLYHFAILLPDRAALGRALLHLHRHRVALGMADHLVSEALYLNDPDGLGIEIYRDRPRTEWRHNGREVVMATESLDVEGVVAASAGVVWDGMPAGTVIGHVHLHVGDIALAETFYAATLGLDVTTRAYPGALFMSAGGYHHHLGANIWARGARAPAPTDAQLLHTELVLADRAELDVVEARFGEAGVVVMPDGDGAFRVHDPFGTPLRITARASLG